MRKLENVFIFALASGPMVGITVVVSLTHGGPAEFIAGILLFTIIAALAGNAFIPGDDEKNP